ncbi:superoxide dismutase family protein [Sphaerisporangium sp. TRM90804]|uniref:superoxide dismutase family protein n=1 Tax=Sphaerisporangium sp. TRM90804 TaxID=3031113 RepID=UPI002447CAAB|nr:superoxide dismutase family protein [Sphaerisporangium sp. TRM90804]MDH2427705.1 superoxide dismutase family protein [Sphaerisporangium sp. TRM90804]
MRTGVMAMLMPMVLLNTGAVSAESAAPRADDNKSTALAVGQFQPYAAGRTAVTYDPKLAPSGALAAVTYVPTHDGKMNVMLRTHGLVANRRYGAHAHVNRCGAKGEDAGPHYQNSKDPVTPSTDPKYANSRNEIWLDFTTDARGNGLGRALVDWQFSDRQAQSVVVHADHTHTEPGKAGTAGARVACLDVAF